jgi:CRP/FNR family cyclic AMP-dependent transcriptional regulator
MTAPTINTFKHETDVVTFPAGQTIFKEGEPGDVMYVVQEGEVDIFIHDRLIETVGAGGIIGELALIDASYRSGSAITRTDCKLVALDETRFKVYVHNTPFFAIQVMRVMANRLRHMDQLF